MNDMVFVFGSNEAGIHGAGAAKIALTQHGALLGKGYGHHGNSFAIPTKDYHIRTLPLSQVRRYISHFIGYAIDHPELQFKVTRIGCGLAGFSNEDIAPMFLAAPDNCWFNTDWVEYLGDVNTWGPHRGNSSTGLQNR